VPRHAPHLADQKFSETDQSEARTARLVDQVPRHAPHKKETPRSACVKGNSGLEVPPSQKKSFQGICESFAIIMDHSEVVGGVLDDFQNKRRDFLENSSQKIPNG
jgi:hypothetical protein